MTCSRYRAAVCAAPTRPISILLLTLLMLAPIGRVAAQWNIASPEGISSFMSINTMLFIDDRIGFALGSMPGASLLFKTTDGGTSWHVQQTSDMLWFGLASSDSATIYITGYLSSCGCAVMVRSTDQGKTWGQGTYDGSFGFYDVKFPTPETGFMAGYNGVILKSSDNGRHWDPVRTGTDDDVFTLLAFPNADTGYAVAGDSGKFYIPDRLYRTTDGGDDWEMIGNYNQEMVISDLTFTTSTTGYLTGAREHHETIMKTTDAGTTWREVHVGRERLPLYGATFIDRNIGYAVGDTGMILRTTDAGETWTEERSNTTSALFDVIAVGNDIFAVGADGVFLKRSSTSAADGWVPGSDATVMIRPNPFVGSATVTLDGAGRGEHRTFILSDIRGREIRRITVPDDATSFQIDREGLPEGIYFYRLLSEGGIVSTGRLTIR